MSVGALFGVYMRRAWREQNATVEELHVKVHRRSAEIEHFRDLHDESAESINANCEIYLIKQHYTLQPQQQDHPCLLHAIAVSWTLL
jgi:hypothetical protein